MAEELKRQGHRVSYRTVAALLHDLDYSLQANRKTREGSPHPDRNAQFEHINRQVRRSSGRGSRSCPWTRRSGNWSGISRTGGRSGGRPGHPEEVRAKDFPDKQSGEGDPVGGLRPDAQRGLGERRHRPQHVSVRHGDHPPLVVRDGGGPIPDADRLLVTADAGGSNGYRCRLWKVALQQLADTIGLRIAVCHFPPGTSKWNKIEHRMFCHITKNWRGKPLLSRAVVVNLIGNTKTKAGLQIQAELDTNAYETGIKVSDEELAAVQIEKATFHGEWNYTISPSRKRISHFGEMPEAVERQLGDMRAGPPGRREVRSKRQHGQQAGSGDLFEEEREQFQRGRVSPVQIFPGAVHHLPLGFLYHPRDQGFLGLLFLLLRTQRERGVVLRMR